jgi:hypothetical protein
MDTGAIYITKALTRSCRELWVWLGRQPEEEKVRVSLVTEAEKMLEREGAATGMRMLFAFENKVRVFMWGVQCVESVEIQVD